MTGQANFLQSLGWAVLNSLWQLALLWVAYQLITAIFRTAKPSLKSSLASSLLTGGFAWFIYTFFTAYTNHADKTIIPSTFVNAVANEQVNARVQQILPIASTLYLVLLVLPLLHFVRNYRYVQIIRKYGLTKMNAEWRMFVNNAAGRINIKQTVQIWVSEFVSSPVTIGFLKPVILVPLAAINHLTTQQLEAVLLHELSHIKRLDYLINLVISFIQTILYFNPFVKAFVKIVEKEREKSCDEMVLQFQYDSHEYASALLALEKVSHDNKPLAIAVTGKKNELLHRVELIMGVHRKPVLSFNKLAGLMAGLLCIISMNALLLFNNPVNNSLRPGGAGNIPSSALLAPSFSFGFDQIHKLKNAAPVVEYSSPVIYHREQNHPVTTSAPPSEIYIPTTIADPKLIQVNFERVAAPELKKYQEEQVEKTMEESKKVLESVQWKIVEKSIADVFNQQEKDELKASYEKEMDKLDWEKWENKLKQAYDKIDWGKINSQLSTAVNQVRLDSIQMVYNKAISKLDDARKELSLNGMNGIPDTDITLKEIERKKANVQRALDELKAVRKKKIVHL
jgi:beta-lactamase regulating signal transducer with metallopeptidase domain